MIVVDASIVAKWLFNEPYSEQARAPYAETLRAGEITLAPSLLSYEVTNVIRQRMRREGWTMAEATRLLSYQASSARFATSLSITIGR